MLVHIKECDSWDWQGLDYGAGDFQQCEELATWCVGAQEPRYYCQPHKDMYYDDDYDIARALELTEVILAPE